MIQAVANSSPDALAGLAARAAMSPRTADELRTLAELGRRLGPTDPDVQRQAATQLLSELFFKPLLAEMRRFPFGRELATGGQTESIFGERLDERVADTVSAGARGVVDAVLSSLDPRGGRSTASRVGTGRDTLPAAGMDSVTWPIDAALDALRPTQKGWAT